jgi:NADPH:quinone reductase-like Zn-dependent oxidoreductase
LNGGFDVVFDCNGSLAVGEEARLRKRGGRIVDAVPTAGKFFWALPARSWTPDASI